jgi:hypothetical protein
VWVYDAGETAGVECAGKATEIRPIASARYGPQLNEQKEKYSMTNAATGIVFHKEPQSAIVEKVRVVVGIKKLSWHDVEIPRLLPEPMPRHPLVGMQVAASGTLGS